MKYISYALCNICILKIGLLKNLLFFKKINFVDSLLCCITRKHGKIENSYEKKKNYNIFFVYYVRDICSFVYKNYDYDESNL